MYNVELKNITLETAQTDVLQVVENICDQFKMENHFGTISTALHEMLSLMERFRKKNKNRRRMSVSMWFHLNRVFILYSLSDMMGLSGMEHS